MKNTTAPPGDLNHFDPIAAFAAASSYAGPEAKLLSLFAKDVRSDGTMDLEAEYFPMVSMTFATKATTDDVASQGKLAPGDGFQQGALIKTELSIISPRLIHYVSWNYKCYYRRKCLFCNRWFWFYKCDFCLQ